MKFKLPFSALMVTLAATLMLGACASSVKLDDLPSVVDRGANSSNNGMRLGGLTDEELRARAAALNASNNSSTSGSSTAINTVDNTMGTQVQQPDSAALAKRSVYFDYDSFVIRDEAKPVLEAHAKNINNNRATKVALEGHTDERGGREYNLALGQKRANAVVQALSVLGVSAAQMEPVSFGKEKPKAQGSSETDYAENRRVDITYR